MFSLSSRTTPVFAISTTREMRNKANRCWLFIEPWRLGLARAGWVGGETRSSPWVVCFMGLLGERDCYRRQCPSQGQ